jgi:hypothetical protein
MKSTAAWRVASDAKSAQEIKTARWAVSVMRFKKAAPELHQQDFMEG